MILKPGDHGSDVEQLQLKLKAAGYDPGDIDGDYGGKTAAAVLAFQVDRPDLDDDRVAGPMTLGALDAAIAKKKPDPPAAPASAVVPCEAATWAAFQRLIAAVTAHPVRYGPGRGCGRVESSSSPTDQDRSARSPGPTRSGSPTYRSTARAG